MIIKGICIKYAFTSNMFKLLNDEETEITRFGNLNYKKSLNVNDDEITIRDALFANSKVWGYEHETRLIFYSINDVPRVKKIKVPGAIKEIYLGMRCSDADERIIKALTKERNIPLYRICTDSEDVYRLRKKLI